MKRFGILFCLGLIGVAAYLLNDKRADTISLFDASAFQSPKNANLFMVALNIENNGEPDRLISASSPSAQNVSIENPGADRWVKPLWRRHTCYGLLCLSQTAQY